MVSVRFSFASVQLFVGVYRSLYALPLFPLSHSSSGVRRKTEGKEERGEAEDKSKRVSKAAARRVGISVTRDGQEVVRNQHLCFMCTPRISTTNAGPEDR